MHALEAYFREIGPVWSALLATTFTWFLTAVGAAFVFVLPGLRRTLYNTMLGFTGGVMVAASFWSLLAPGIAYAESLYPGYAWLPAATGFGLGAAFLYGLDKLLPHLHLNFGRHEPEGPRTEWRTTTLMLLAITLHNIPEGLAVGVLFGAAAQGLEGGMMMSAITLAIGIGLQNMPEGLAVSMPLRAAGLSRAKSFWYGQLSAVVEPIAGVLGALAVIYIQPFLPFALAFAAGAMIYVVVEEVIPQTQRERHSDLSVLGFMGGFVVMMVLDVALGQ